MKLYLKTMFVLVSLFQGTSLLFAGGVCFHCEEIREYNRQHPQKCEYYEDYLEEQKNKTTQENKAIEERESDRVQKK